MGVKSNEGISQASFQRDLTIAGMLSAKCIGGDFFDVGFDEAGRPHDFAAARPRSDCSV